MNGEQFGGICQQLAGRVNEARGKLTDDPLRAAAGRRAQIFGKAQQRSGIVKEEAARQLRNFLNSHRNWLT